MYRQFKTHQELNGNVDSLRYTASSTSNGYLTGDGVIKGVAGEDWKQHSQHTKDAASERVDPFLHGNPVLQNSHFNKVYFNLIPC